MSELGYAMALIREKSYLDEDNDLFRIYAQNHISSVTNTLVFLLLSIGVTYYIDPEIFMQMLDDKLIYMVGFVSFFLQYKQYNILQKKPKLNRGNVLFLIANKSFYSIIFLYWLYFPLEVVNIYQHILSYFFIMIAMIRFASSSATYLPLFLTEICLYSGFSLFVLFSNIDFSRDNPLFPIFLILTFFFILVAGIRNFETSIGLIKKKAELKSAVRRAEDALKVKSSFLAAMSHEIRTPLSGIIGMIRFLKEAPLRDDQKECIDVIDSCSNNLLNTLNDILDASKLESGKFSIDKVNFDLYYMTKNIHKLLKPKAAEKGLAFDLNIHSDIPQYILSDPNRMQQVIMNLCNNALKFTEKGSVSINISLRQTPEPTLRFDISDTGMGITEEDQKKLFQSFSQVDGSIARKFGGTGLGLSIVKQLVELMDGQVGVVSNIGKGSTFWFELPCVPAEKFQDDESDTSVNIIVPKGIKVLVAEDNHVNRLIMAKLLERQGYRFDFAMDGHQALDMARNGDYGLILMDMQMPGKDGLQATRDIRALGEKFETLPIIGLTANTMEDQIQACLDAGMVDHVGKPIDPDLLFKKMALYSPSSVQKDALAMMSAPPKRPEAQITKLRRQKGEQFTAEFIAEAQKKIARLAEALRTAVGAQDMAAVHQKAHDLKQVAGSIDRPDLVINMSKIQLLAQKGDPITLNDALSRIAWT
jgi:signal transduction histidine kinase/DNA-binding response OmpR family regulator